MNQKNIFTIISALLVLQGTGIFVMSGSIALDSFPGLSSEGLQAVSEMATVVGVLIAGLGTITFFVRENPSVLPGYAIAFSILALNTAKHLLISGVSVPLPIFILQIFFVVSTIYLLLKGNRQITTN